MYRTDWGHSAEDLLAILSGGEHSDGDDLLEAVQVIGVNCGAEPERDEHTGMPYALNGIRQLSQGMGEKGVGPKRLMAYPNAGKARLDKARRTYYSQSPEEMAAFIPGLLGAGAYLIGGCCGTGPAHIRAFRRAVDENLHLVEGS